MWSFRKGGGSMSNLFFSYLYVLPALLQPTSQAIFCTQPTRQAGTLVFRNNVFWQRYSHCFTRAFRYLNQSGKNVTCVASKIPFWPLSQKYHLLLSMRHSYVGCVGSNGPFFGNFSNKSSYHFRYFSPGRTAALQRLTI
jgi:hypothetical protein